VGHLEDRIHGTAAALRRSFDETFAAPITSTIESQEGLLAIRIGADPYALRLSEVVGLHANLKITAVPSSVSQLLGIVGLRGMMAPVYDLAALMHYPQALNACWVVLAGATPMVGFAFDSFEAHLRVPAASMPKDDDKAGGSDASRGYTRGTVRAAGALRPIIRVASIMELIRNDKS
jgi:chemotaxis signal transduction protein